MNREILFRAKSLTTLGKWVEGYYVYDSLGHQIVSKTDGSCWNIDPDTICQCTGLLDSKGNRIWEGDLVRVYHRREEDEESFHTVGVVEYSPAEFYIRGDGYSITCHFHYNKEDREVIGNIFDNPELLNEQ